MLRGARPHLTSVHAWRDPCAVASTTVRGHRSCMPTPPIRRSRRSLAARPDRPAAGRAGHGRAGVGSHLHRRADPDHAPRRGQAADRPGCTVLPDLPDRQRLEHPDRRAQGRRELGHDDLRHRPRPRPAHGLRLVRGLRHPVPGRDREPRRARRSRSTTPSESDQVGYPIPASPKIEGGLGPPHPHGRQGRLPAVRAVRGPQVGRPLVCRQRRDLGPALQHAPPRRLDQRRRGRPADPARARPLRRGRGRRHPARPAVHDQPDAQGLHLPGAPPRERLDLDLAATDGPARPAQGVVRHVAALARTRVSSPRPSSATG